MKESHHTFSFPLALNPLDAPPALGASGIPVPCALGVELDALGWKEVAAAVTLDP